jgi:hypothetical protein
MGKCCVIVFVANLLRRISTQRKGKGKTCEGIEREQSCQIFIGTMYQNEKNITNGHIQTTTKFIDWP